MGSAYLKITGYIVIANTNWTRTKASNCIFYQHFMKGFCMKKKMIANAFIHAKLDGNFQNSGNFQGLF